MNLPEIINIPKVSYIIPVKDESDSLEITLRNLYSVSSEHSFEIIIVDDHSIKPVIELLDDELLRKCKVFRNESRLGVAKSRAKGANEASGDFFIFLDAHVCLRKDMLSQFLSTYKYYPFSIFGIPIFHETDFDRFKSYVDGRIDLEGPEVYGGWRLELGEKPDTIPLPLKQDCSVPYRVPIVGAAGMILSKELYFRIGGFDQDLVGYGNAEDAELCLRAWAFGCEVRLMPKSVAAHYLSPDKLKLKELTNTSSTHAQYDLAEVNASRVMLLHLPMAQIEKYLSKNFAQDYWEAISNRIFFIEENRVWSKAQVLRIAMESIFIDKISPVVSKFRGSILIFSDSEEECSDLLTTLPDASLVLVLCDTLQLKLALEERFPQAICLCVLEDVRFDSLDELFHFYRGVVWDRGFKSKDLVLSNYPDIINTRIEDSTLQYVAPIWMLEDFILRYGGGADVTLYLAMKDVILEEALRTSQLLSRLCIKLEL